MKLAIAFAPKRSPAAGPGGRLVRRQGLASVGDLHAVTACVHMHGEIA